MHIAILGSGAVGGFYGARLARAGQQVTFIARGAHLEAIRQRGLLIWSPLGDFNLHAPAESDTRRVGAVDAVLVAVKTYGLERAAALLPPLMGPDTVVVTLQNGVDAPEQVAQVVGRAPVVGGAAYIGAALLAPGLVEQTGTGRRIVFGEIFDPPSEVSPRVKRLAEVFAEADIQAEAVPDARVPMWEKFIFLAPIAGLAAAARVPVGDILKSPHGRAQMLAAVQETERVARAEGVPVAADIAARVMRLCDAIPPTMRPSMLLDITAGKPLELDTLQGSVVRRGAACGVPTPVMSTLYAVLEPHAAGHPFAPPASRV
jgi:2-dehydropantoate 2-reductase